MPKSSSQPENGVRSEAYTSNTRLISTVRVDVSWLLGFSSCAVFFGNGVWFGARGDRMLTFALTTQQRLQRASVAFADLLCMRISALYPGIAHNHYGQGIFFTHTHTFF